VTEALSIRHLTHRFGQQVALDDVSLDVASGEFLTILGPSGSGKTTLLRVIGGFEQGSEAERLLIAGEDMRGLPPNLRPVTTVFQHYALFPHMSVVKNVEYGLKLRGVPPQTRTQRAEEALSLVRLAGKSHRRISELSGGERQRVALARALVVQPAILLLDEPMGALDEKLRHDMQIEIRDLQRSTGTTFIQVTHSQEEALTMSNRVAVMNRGRIEQVGPPQAIFDRPATRFVAEFMGLRNVIDGAVAAIDGDYVGIEQNGQPLWGRWTGAQPPRQGERAFFALHPSRLRIVLAGQPEAFLSATPIHTIYKGAELEVEFETPRGRLTASLPRPLAGGEAVHLGWSRDAAVVGPETAGQPVPTDA
jgi:spermidine/putrescine transport system ATP-binding protein